MIFSAWAGSKLNSTRGECGTAGEAGQMELESVCLPLCIIQIQGWLWHCHCLCWCVAGTGSINTRPDKTLYMCLNKHMPGMLQPHLSSPDVRCTHPKRDRERESRDRAQSHKLGQRGMHEWIANRQRQIDSGTDRQTDREEDRETWGDRVCCTGVCIKPTRHLLHWQWYAEPGAGAWEKLPLQIWFVRVWRVVSVPVLGSQCQ